MDESTRAALAAINRHFYHHQARAFSDTRSRPWKGWRRVVETVGGARPKDASLRLLDVGCGNGRFGGLVGECWPGPLSYVGLDASEELLETAGRRLASLAEVRLASWDFMDDSLGAVLGEETFSLIAVFGLLHHVPGEDLRRELLQRLAGRLEVGGVLALSVWRFGLDARFQRRVLPWEEYNRGAQQPIPIDLLEEGDVLLRWGDQPGVVRYCHAVSEPEQESWTEMLGLAPLESFVADGKGGELNQYHLFSKAAAVAGRTEEPEFRTE